MHRLTLTLLALVFACGDDDGTFRFDGAAPCTEDSQCDDGQFCNGPERCAPTASGASPLGCVAGSSPCLAGQTCEELDDRCNAICSVTMDADGDGHLAMACGGIDCDDSDPNRFPGNVEVCDVEGHDEDCDDTTVGDMDRDRDGFVDLRCCNGATCGDDCDDTNRSTHPLAAEACNRVDDDCDGDVDEEVSTDGFVDADGDGYGDSPTLGCPGPGFSLLGGDCMDMAPDVHPGTFEVADGVDDDCDGISDESPASVRWYVDMDDDGYGDPALPSVMATTSPPGDYARNALDCDDTAGGVNPAAVEICDGIDQNCDGRLGPGEDIDRDGELGIACGGADCDDTDPFTRPDSAELCDGRDNDCDGSVDEDVAPAPFYVDADGDSYGAGAPREMCAPSGAFVPRGGDCDDGDASVHPGAPERCDGLVQSCGAPADLGASCRLPFASASCREGTCVITECPTGRGDCNGLASDGCEVETNTVENCGGCGITCSTGRCLGTVCEGGATDWFTVSLNHYWVPTTAMRVGGQAFLPFPPASEYTSFAASDTTIVVRGPGMAPPLPVQIDYAPLGTPWITVDLLEIASGQFAFYLTPSDIAAVDAGTPGITLDAATKGMVVLQSAHRSGIDWSAARIGLASEGSVLLTPSGSRDTELFVFVNVTPGALSVTAFPTACTLMRPAPARVFASKVTSINLTCP